MDLFDGEDRTEIRLENVCCEFSFAGLKSREWESPLGEELLRKSGMDQGRRTPQGSSRNLAGHLGVFPKRWPPASVRPCHRSCSLTAAQNLHNAGFSENRGHNEDSSPWNIAQPAKGKYQPHSLIPFH